MLGVFLRLVFVEERHDLAHHDMHRVVAHFLGDGQQADAVLGQFADVEFQFEVVAEEAAERMDDDHFECGGFSRSGIDHALEFRTPIIGRRCARVNIGFDQVIAPCEAIGFALLALIRDRDIMLGLPCCRHAKIEGSAERHVHDGGLLRSSAGAEHIIEEVAEPRFEHINFGVRDRHPAGPVVRDGPGLKVMSGRASRKWPWLAQQVFKLFGRGGRTLARYSRHGARVADPTR
jgi:hypothetical protein